MTKKDNGYYNTDIDFKQILLDSGMLSEIFYLKDLEQRKIYINSDIEQEAISDVVRHILQFNSEDLGRKPEDRMPIVLYITSRGGDVDTGFELIDAIQSSKTPVYTVNLGFQYSMGFLVGLAGHKRFAMKNAKYLMHDGSNFICNSGAKAQDQMEFNKKVEDRIRQYVLSRSKISGEDYDGKLRVEWYLFADEAKERGFVDYIIGEDCDIDEIV